MTIALNFIALASEQGSGAYQYIHRMLAMLRYYDLNGVQFIVYKQKQISRSYIGMPEHLSVTYVDVPRLGNGLPRVLFEQTLFYRYLLPCDVMYSYCTSMPLWIHARRVFTLHDIYFLTTRERYGLLQRLYLKWVTGWYIRRATRILTVSQYSYQEILRFYPEANGKLSLTYNFLFPPLTQPTYYKADTKKPYFLYVGNLQPGKNIVRMIEGFKQFNAKHTYRLHIVGKPTGQSESVLQHIRQSPDVIYHGYVNANTLQQLYQQATAVVLLSLCEGFGIPPLEGFGYGKPALVSNRTSLPEVVGNAGIAVCPTDIEQIADGFQKVLAHKEELIRNIPQRLLQFDAHTSCETFMQYLQIPYTRL